MIVYDENGFDENWNHKDTGTRYDTFGFNKNSTIHKITKSSFDEFGFTREDYKKNSLIHKLYNDLLKMDNPSLLKFDGETFFSDLNLKIENISKINLLSFNVEKNADDISPRKLDGSKDYRYKSNYKYSISVIIKINFNNDISKTCHLKNINISKETIESDLQKSNTLLTALKNEKTLNQYFKLISFKKQYLELLKKIKSLDKDNHSDSKLYEEIKSFKSNFNELQKIKFLELESKIINNTNELKILEDNMKDIEEKSILLHKTLKDEIDVVYNSNQQISNITKINELFEKLE